MSRAASALLVAMLVVGCSNGKKTTHSSSQTQRIATQVTTQRAPTRRPIVIARVAHPIVAIAQNGGRIAFRSEKAGTTCGVFILGVFSRRTQTLTTACDGYPSGSLAFDGRRALWTTLYRAGNTECHMKVLTGQIGRRVRTVYDAFYSEYDPKVSGPECSGGLVVAGGDGTLVFREFPYDELNGRPKPLARVIGRRAVPIAGSIPQGDVEVAAGRLLILPDEQPPWLELRKAGTGARIARIPQPVATAEIGLSSSFAALLARGHGGMRVFLYDAADGSAKGGVAVPTDASELSISGARIAFVSGRTIWLVDGNTKHKSAVVTSQGIPFGILLSGGTLVWAENARGHGRFMALELAD